jgi:hypothetical protein
LFLRWRPGATYSKSAISLQKTIRRARSASWTNSNSIVSRSAQGRMHIRSLHMQTNVIFGRTVHGRYLIFYDIVNRTVRILRIIHGARDWERLLFPPE